MEEKKEKLVPAELTLQLPLILTFWAVVTFASIGVFGYKALTEGIEKFSSAAGVTLLFTYLIPLIAIGILWLITIKRMIYKRELKLVFQPMEGSLSILFKLDGDARHYRERIIALDAIESYQIEKEINVVGNQQLFNQITQKNGRKYRIPLSCYFASWDLRRLPLLSGYVTLIDRILGNLLAPHLDNGCDRVEDQNDVVSKEGVGYKWCCSACEKPNGANQSHCQQCSCPAVATGVVVAKFQKSSDGDAIEKSSRNRIGVYLLVVMVALIQLRLYFIQSEYPYYQVVSGKMSRIFMKDEFRTIPANSIRVRVECATKARAHMDAKVIKTLPDEMALVREMGLLKRFIGYCNWSDY